LVKLQRTVTDTSLAAFAATLDDCKCQNCRADTSSRPCPHVGLRHGAVVCVCVCVSPCRNAYGMFFRSFAVEVGKRMFELINPTTTLQVAIFLRLRKSVIASTRLQRGTLLMYRVAASNYLSSKPFVQGRKRPLPSQVLQSVGLSTTRLLLRHSVRHDPYPLPSLLPSIFF